MCKPYYIVHMYFDIKISFFWMVPHYGSVSLTIMKILYQHKNWWWKYAVHYRATGMYLNMVIIRNAPSRPPPTPFFTYLQMKSPVKLVLIGQKNHGNSEFIFSENILWAGHIFVGKYSGGFRKIASSCLYIWRNLCVLDFFSTDLFRH